MKLLLATDGSRNGVEAARFLSELKAQEQFDVTVLTVGYDPSYGGSSVQPWLPEWQELENRRVDEHHAEVRNLLAATRSAITTVRKNGNPRQLILDEAKRLDVDLIVVGARGHSMLARMMLGSVSDHIATHAECWVLVVRSKTSGEPVQPTRKIIIGFDGSAGSREAIEELMNLKLNRETFVNVVSVVPTMEFYSEPFSAMIEAEEHQEMDRKRMAGERIASRIASWLPETTTQIAKGQHVGDTIVATAEQNDADLVVVGETGHGLLGEWILGSTSKYVLRHAPCSVWVSRHHRTTDAIDTENGENAS